MIIIALLTSLAVFGVLSTFEGKRRTTTAVNDAIQSGNFGLFYIDKLIRNAGSGFSQNFIADFGCQLNVYNSSGTTTTIPASDFPGLTTDAAGVYVLAPVIIDAGGSASSDGTSSNHSDALIVMEGASGNAEYGVPLTAAMSGATTLPTINTVPFQPSDLLLMTDSGVTTQAPCMATQVSSSFNPLTNAGATPGTPLPLAGQFYKATIGTASLVSYSKSAMVMDLGNPTSDAPPSFEILGVNPKHVLVDYAMLNQTGVSNEVSDGVFEMHAIYGVDAANTGTITWVAPTATGWTYATLSQQRTGSAAGGDGAYALERIKAIRVGLILRTDLPENTKNPSVPITAGPLTLFAGTGATITRTLSTAETGYRYRTVEVTIPVRNNLLIAK